MKIAGMVVRAFPDTLKAVNQRLEMLPGVEIHGISDKGQMVVTVEEQQDTRLADQITQVQSADGVLSASLIYSHFDETDDQEMSL